MLVFHLPSADLLPFPLGLNSASNAQVYGHHHACTYLIRKHSPTRKKKTPGGGSKKEAREVSRAWSPTAPGLHIEETEPRPIFFFQKFRMNIRSATSRCRFSFHNKRASLKKGGLYLRILISLFIFLTNSAVTNPLSFFTVTNLFSWAVIDVN